MLKRVQAQQYLRKSGCIYRLIDPPPRIVRLLEMSGMDKKLSVEKVYRGNGKETKGNEG